MQRGGVRGRASGCQMAQRRPGSQHTVMPDRCMQRQVVPQRIVIGDIFPAAAQRVQTLPEQIACRMGDAGRATPVGKHLGDGTREANMLVGAPQQQHARVITEVPVVELGLDHPASDPS